MRRAIQLSVFIVAVAACLAGAAVVAIAQSAPSGHADHNAAGQPMDMPQHGAHGSAMADARQLVVFPEMMRQSTLANMRDHLQALADIQQALAGGHFDAAADIAESRLGMNSLSLHGAHEVAPLMPAGMQQAGTAMHHAASRFALAAKDAGVTGDLKPALQALGETMQACAACHSGYRLQ